MLGLLLFALFQAIISNILPNILPIIKQISVEQEGGSPESDESFIPRIAYGAPVDISEYPFFVGLNGCGGAIISEEWVVTAAHCVYPRKTVGDYVLVGGARKDNSILVKIEDIIVHPCYIDVPSKLVMNDIALIKLAIPLEFKANIQPLDLPGKNEELDVGSKLVFIGRGADEFGKQSEQLMKIEVNIYPTDDCYREYYPNLYWYFRPFLSLLRDTTICSKRVEKLIGPGRGDSGSPMVKDNVLIGLASYSYSSENDRLLFLTNVAHFVPWIKSVTGEFQSEFGLEYMWSNSESVESVEEEEDKWFEKDY